MFVKGEIIHAVAGNPRKLMVGSKANGAANAKKTVRINYGRAYEEAQAGVASQSGDNATPAATSTSGAIPDNIQTPARMESEPADPATTVSADD